MPLRAWLTNHGPVLTLFIAVIALTHAYYLGDTQDYVSNILGHINGNHGLRWDPLWEFGHLLWRPLGLVLLKALQAISADAFGLTPNLLLTSAFIGVNVLCSAGFAVLTHSLLWTATRSRAIAVGVTTAFVVSNSVLNYSQTGNAYITGLFFVTLGVWILKRATDQDTLSDGSAYSGGAALACAGLFWFPYVFVAPAAVLIPIVYRRSAVSFASASRYVLKTVAAFGLVLLLAYGAVVAHLGISSPSELREWVMNAGHGVKPGIKTNSMRLVFGIPRAFIDMGDDGKLIKRYLYKDPYAPTSVADIVITAGAPLALFYGTLAVLLWFASKSREGRQALLVLAAAFVPVGLFAVVVFEAGSMERYLPVYPFLALAVAHGLQPNFGWNFHRWLAAVLFAVITIRSGMAMSPMRAAERQQAQVDRIGAIRQELGVNGVLVILNYQDEVMHFAKTYPFHPLNRPKAVATYSVFETGNARMDVWREEFAQRVARAWNEGGTVWVAKRFLAERPLPSWNWVEGEDQRISWARSREFFRQFEYERETGGEDGFAVLKQSQANRTRIEPLAVTK